MAEIYVVASGKGGVGKSTFVAGISKALSGYGKKVLAIDFDIGLRSLDLLLGNGDQVVFDWGDAVTGRCTPEQSIIKGYVDFVSAPRSFEDDFTESLFRDYLKSVSIAYDYIFIDAPAGIGTGFSLASKCASKGIVVTTPDCICVRSCSRAHQEMLSNGINDIRLVINMFDLKPVTKNKLLNVDECIDETGVQLLGVIPMDRNIAFTSVIGKDPDEFTSSNQAFYRIAGRLAGKRIPLVCR